MVFLAYGGEYQSICNYKNFCLFSAFGGKTKVFLIKKSLSIPCLWWGIFYKKKQIPWSPFATTEIINKIQNF